MVEAAPSPSFKMSQPDLLLEFLIVAFDNVTGLSSQSPDAAGKRLELLRMVVLGLRRLAVLTDVANPFTKRERSGYGWPGFVGPRRCNTCSITGTCSIYAPGSAEVLR